MLELWTLYNVVFYFGSIILTAALLFLAWKSTYVPGQQNITVVVWQHPSGRQTLQRLTASSGNINSVHHNEQYEQIPFESSGIEDISEVDSDEDLTVGRIINIVQEAVQATNVALQGAQENNILPSSVPLSDTVNHSSSQRRSPVMEPTPSTQSDPLQGANSNSNSPQASNSTATSSSDSTNAQSVRPKTFTALSEVAVENSDKSSNSPPSDFLLDPPKKQDTECISSSSSLENRTKEHSFSKVLTGGSEPAAASSSSFCFGTSLIDDAHTRPSFDTEVEDGSQEVKTSVQEPYDNFGAFVASPIRNSDVSHDAPTDDEASNPQLQKCTMLSSTEHKDKLSSEAQPIGELSSSETVAGESSRPAPGTDDVEGSIRVRLKFLDDQQKTVQGILTQNILCFKRKHFGTELSEHRVVRLIFNGRLLKQDDSTLAEYGLYDNCVVHCHVSQPKPPPALPASATAVPGPTAARQGGAARRLLHMFRNITATDTLDVDDPAEEGLNISNYLSGLLWLVVAGLWVARLKHSYMFSSFSTFMLVFLTLLLVVPHYLFSVDVQLDLSLDTRTLRNLGIDRVVVLQRRQTGGEQQPPNQGGEQRGTHQDGPSVQDTEATPPQPSSQGSSGNNRSGASLEQTADATDSSFARELDAGSASTDTPVGSAVSDPSGDRPPNPLESTGGARRRHVVYDDNRYER